MCWQLQFAAGYEALVSGVCMHRCRQDVKAGSCMQHSIAAGRLPLTAQTTYVEAGSVPASTCTSRQVGQAAVYYNAITVKQSTCGTCCISTCGGPLRIRMVQEAGRQAG
jgi:hypothetical protein